MPTSKQLSQHVHQVYFGGNWTDVNFKATISDIPFEMALKKIKSFNTIVSLTFHIHYFLKVQLRVLEEGILEGKDSESYKHPNISSQSQWEQMQEAMWQDAERYTELLSNLENDKLSAIFIDRKYGNYFSNVLGLIEHAHYHLGQIVILKKLINSRVSNN